MLSFLADQVSIPFRPKEPHQSIVDGCHLLMETTRSIFLDACEAIASPLVAKGFRYAKSGPRCSKRFGDFEAQIIFGSSVHNVMGSTVKLWISGIVHSKRLELWRANFPLLHGGDHVAGGNIGNLTVPNEFRDWNLSDRGERAAVIANANRLMDEVVLPYFLQFEDLSGMISRVASCDVPSFRIDSVIDFLMCYAGAPTARQAAVNFLARRPNLVSDYQRDFGRYAEHGLGLRRLSGNAGSLALASHLFGFGDLTAS